MVNCRSRVAVALVILALLAFTTIRTSPISAGTEPGSTLSKTTPKQRKLSVEDFVWTATALTCLEFVPADYGRVVMREPAAPRPKQFLGRYFTLPPPIA